MSFYHNIGQTEVPNPAGGEPLFVRTPVESLAWNSTPVSWTSSSTSVGNTTTSIDTSSSSRINAIRGGVDTIITTNTTNRRVTSSTEETTSTTTLASSSTTTSTLIPYMRAKRIKFKSSGLKPNSKLIAKFENVDVSKYCTQTSSTRPVGTLVAEPTGSIEGYFDLPGNTFKTGKRLFSLEDSTDKEISNASTEYSAIGERLDTTVTNAFDTTINIQKTITEQTFTSSTTSSRRRFPRDPVAQSFFVDTAETSNGVFIHSIDLFFFEVDPKHEVLVEIRRMRDGYPTLDLMHPYSFTKLIPSKINSTINGTVPTRFTFETPVYLPASEEYCFVVLSNSEKTSIWCSELGKKSFTAKDTIAPSGELISKQPYLGTMFISQNNSTWDAQQLRDVKFTINRCKFNKNPGKIEYINSTENDTFNYPNKKFMAPNALEFTKSSNVVWLYAHGHAMQEGDKFRLHFFNENLPSMFGIPKNLVENVPLVVTGTTATKISFVVPKSANGTGSSGGTGMWMDGWVIGYSYAQLIKKDIALDNTSITYNLSGKLQTNYTGPATNSIPLISNRIVELPAINVVKADNDRGAVIKSDISTANDMISPIVYADSIGIEGHMNIINNIDYQNAVGTNLEDSSPSKYIQREVSLINAANELKVYFESSMVYGSNISVYYKCGNGEIDPDIDWVKMVPESGQLTHSLSTDDWRTQKFTKSFDTEWDVFQVMLVLYSDSRLVIPKVKNYRAIALNA